VRLVFLPTPATSWKHAGHLLQEAADNAARRIAAAGHADESILRDAEDKVGTIEP
jgi:hypothetical protein